MNNLFCFELIMSLFSIVGNVPIEEDSRFGQISDVEILHYQHSLFFLISQDFKSLNSSEALCDSALKSFILQIYFSEFLLSIVFYDVTQIDFNCLEKYLGSVWVGMHANFDLLELHLELFEHVQFWLLFFFLLLHLAWAFIFNAQFLVSFLPHLFKQFCLIFFILSFLNLVQLDLSFHSLFFSDSLCFNHLLPIPNPVFLPFPLFFSLSFYSRFTSLID